MKQNHCTPDLSEFSGGLQKIFIRTLYIKHKLRDGAEHNTLMGVERGWWAQLGARAQ
jgi:hypothetical protein